MLGHVNGLRKVRFEVCQNFVLGRRRFVGGQHHMLSGLFINDLNEHFDHLALCFYNAKRGVDSQKRQNGSALLLLGVWR